ncbi:hypothetical protein MLD38_009035 [Melastoma candidum]|uniref:Uncharacterized protein n=1 Tax=Melastoma candidum TaxID=119954 RepID=A0ACB9RXK3_9MYRT|nr:hypothetical protein MLD38_009035 [Melastoma candidum]
MRTAIEVVRMTTISRFSKAWEGYTLPWINAARRSRTETRNWRGGGFISSGSDSLSRTRFHLGYPPKSAFLGGEMNEATGASSAARTRDGDPEFGAGGSVPRQRRPDPFEDETWRSLRWMMLFLLSLLAVSLDPLFFYIPVINDKETCVRPDWKLGIIAIALRTYADVVHTLFWLLCYEDRFRVPLKRLWICVVKKCGCSCIREPNEGDDGSVSGTLIREAREADAAFAIKEKSSMDEKYEKSNKLRGIEILSVLPLPQVVTILIIVRRGSPKFTDAVTLLKFSVLSQLILRALRVYPSYKGATRHSLLLLRGRVWVGSALNLVLFVISGHAIGAFWYLLSLGRSMDCWKNACRRHDGCHIASLYCGGETIDKSFLNATCPVDPSSDSPPFNFGIYSDALESRIVSSSDFPLKLGYCFWWGLRNLSSLGQNLSTSPYLWEVCFAISISVIGLILFSLFIGNMQMYLQSQTDNDLKEMKEMMEKKEKLKKVRKSLVKWTPFSHLEKELRHQIFLCDDPKWLETKDVDLKSTIQNISPELGMQIKLELCFPQLSKTLEQVDKRSLEALCGRARPVVFGENRSILHEDTPLDKMYIVVGGDLFFHVKEDGSTPKSPPKCTDKFLGEKLLHQVLNGEQSSNSHSIFPDKTIMARTKVEAFSITASDIRRVRSQFRGRFYKREKEEWTNATLQKAISRFSQKRSVNSPRQSAGSNNTTAGAIKSQAHHSGGIEEGSCPQIKEDDSLP